MEQCETTKTCCIARGKGIKALYAFYLAGQPDCLCEKCEAAMDESMGHPHLDDSAGASDD